MANEGLGRDSLLKMVHNPGGDWHPGWGVDLSYPLRFFGHLARGLVSPFCNHRIVGSMRPTLLPCEYMEWLDPTNTSILCGGFGVVQKHKNLRLNEKTRHFTKKA